MNVKKTYDPESGYGIRLDGIVTKENGESLNHDEFWNKLIDFVESENWLFAGFTETVDAEGESLPLDLTEKQRDQLIEDFSSVAKALENMKEGDHEPDGT